MSSAKERLFWRFPLPPVVGAGAPPAVSHRCVRTQHRAIPFSSHPWLANTGHWNEFGHEMAGTPVAQSLLQGSSVIPLWISSATNPNLPPGHMLEIN